MCRPEILPRVRTKPDKPVACDFEAETAKPNLSRVFATPSPRSRHVSPLLLYRPIIKSLHTRLTWSIVVFDFHHRLCRLHVPLMVTFRDASAAVGAHGGVPALLPSAHAETRCALVPLWFLLSPMLKPNVMGSTIISCAQAHPASSKATQRLSKLGPTRHTAQDHYRGISSSVINAFVTDR